MLPTGKFYLAPLVSVSKLFTVTGYTLQKGITEVQSINVVGYLRKTLAVEKTDKEAFKVKSKKLEDNEGTTAREWFENQWKVKEDGGNDDEEEDNVVVSTSGCGLLDRLKTHFLRRLDQENELDKRCGCCCVDKHF